MHRDEARKRGGKVGRIMGGGKGAERGEEGKEKEERAMLGRGCEFVLRITPQQITLFSDYLRLHKSKEKTLKLIISVVPIKKGEIFRCCLFLPTLL